MTLQEPFKWQPEVEQHHLVRSLPNPPAPQGRRRHPRTSLRWKERCRLAAHQASPPGSGQTHLALEEPVSRYKEGNSFGRTLVSAEADPSGFRLCRWGVGELEGPKLPWQEGRLLQSTSLCKEALELHQCCLHAAQTPQTKG